MKVKLSFCHKAVGDPEAISSFFGPISGQVEPLLTNEQLKGLISDHIEKKFEFIIKIGQVKSIFPSEKKVFQKLKFF